MTAVATEKVLDRALERVATLPAPVPAREPGEQLVEQFSIVAIAPDPEQPRDDADEDLADSIAAQGVLQPITIRSHPKATSHVRFMIVDGERRWRGAKKAGLTLIPAIYKADIVDEATLLIQQSTFNTGKALSAGQEARTWKRIQELTGKNIAELARLLGRPKSTVSDRIALSEAPEVFRPLFECGAFTAAAGPIARKYAQVPAKTLERVVSQSTNSWRWNRYVADGKPIPMKEIESALESELSFAGVQKVSKPLAPYFKGATFPVGDATMTADLKALEAAQTAYNHEQERVARAAGPAKDEKAPKPRRDPHQQRWEREQAQRRAASMRFNRAKPAVLAAFANAIKKARTGISANGRSAVAELVLKECNGQGATKDVVQLLPVGSDAESILRHAAFLCVVNISANSYLRENHMPRLAKQFGVDLNKVLDAAAPKKGKAKKGKK